MSSCRNAGYCVFTLVSNTCSICGANRKGVYENTLVNLYHLARTVLVGTGRDTRHNRMLWAAKEYAKEYKISETLAYKSLDRLVNW